MLSDINIFFLKSEKYTIVFIIFLIIITVILELVGISAVPVLLYFFIDNKEFGSSLFLLNSFKSYLINKDFVNNKVNIILIISFCLIFLFIIKNLLLFFISKYESKFFERIVVRNSINLYNYYISQDYLYHLNHSPNFLSKNIILEMQVIRGVVVTWINIFKEGFILLGLSLILFFFNPTILLFIFLILLIVAYLFFFIIKKDIQQKGKEINDIRNSQLKYIAQDFASIKDIKIFNKENFLISKFEKHIKLFQSNTTYFNIVNTIPKSLMETTVITIIAGTCFFLILSNKSFEYILFYLGVLSTCGIRLIPSYNQLSLSFSKLKFLQSPYKIIKNEIINCNKFSRLKKEQTKNFFFKNNIQFEGVSFCYPNTKINAISNISFVVKENSIFGITGQSGSGKTTLGNLLLGLVDPTSGSIFMDGKNRNTINKKTWFKNFSYVSQDLYLINDTVKSNIAFGLSNESIDNQKINRLIKILDLVDFVNNLENGLETNIGNMGLKISGGQRQKIGIARALYFESKILVLDESTSALDKKSEEFFIKLFKKLKKEMTIIIIFHSQSIAKICNKIIKLKNGKIIS